MVYMTGVNKHKRFNSDKKFELMATTTHEAAVKVLDESIDTMTLASFISMDKMISTREAAEILEYSPNDEIIVTDGDNNVGMVTDKDILHVLSDETTDVEQTILEDIMSTPLHMIGIDKKLRDALDLMRKVNHPKLPVINDKKIVVGMLYRDAIIKKVEYAARQAEARKSFSKVILGNLGFLLQFAGILLLVPALVATFMGDTITATGIYLSTVLMLTAGFFLNSYGEKSAMNVRQASVLVVSSLLLLSLFGTIPYLYALPDTQGGVVDITQAAMPPDRVTDFEMFSNAFFSSAAGFSTGGISLYETPEDLPPSFIFYRSYTQLVGGMSFIYLIMTAFYPDRKLEAFQNFITGEKRHTRELFVIISIIFTLYIIIVAALLYSLGNFDHVSNFSLAMSTLATGGFVPDSGALDNMGWQKQLVLMAAMLLGAMPFTFHYAFIRKKFRLPRVGREVTAYLALLAGFTIIFVILDGSRTLDSVFHVISAGTTAGLEHASLYDIQDAGLWVLMFLMFVGGCGFSTAGGIKMFRLLQLVDVTYTTIKRIRFRMSINIRKNIWSTVIVACSMPIVAVATGGYLVEVEGMEPREAIFDAVGIITTGGLSLGSIDFETSAATKILLSLLMIFGRLEVIALVYIVVPILGTRYNEQNVPDVNTKND